jgi:glycine/D-amino acid oxidase-like deaminating enzyme
VERRDFLSGSAMLGLAGLGGCATAPTAMPGFRGAPQLAPVRASVDRIMNITVCLRPFRAAGPRLDAETVGDKLVVHNYGHGGSGWSLSWGSGLIVVAKAMSTGERDIAVIGAGALGLTAATLAQRAGCRVTIYAKEWMPDVRSARATGVWSPDSRIALEKAVDANFPAFWEEMTRASFRIHSQYVGFSEAPVAWTERYMLSDGSSSPTPDPIGFAHLGGRVRDLTPATVTLAAGDHPFPVPHVRKATLPLFNIHEYGHVLLTDFLQAGGKIETREFRSPAELAGLKQKAIINCTGYGARALWRDESIVPVRGQIAWLIPQPEVTYGITYRGVSVVSRRDGMVVQKAGQDEGWGWNDADETVDRAESEQSVATVARIFSPAGKRAASA